jgi:hypothetical protein
MYYILTGAIRLGQSNILFYKKKNISQYINAINNTKNISLIVFTDYVKFMCGKVLSGGGFFPWILLSVNRAIQWIWSSKSNSQHEEN